MNDSFFPIWFPIWCGFSILNGCFGRNLRTGSLEFWRNSNILCGPQPFELRGVYCISVADNAHLPIRRFHAGNSVLGYRSGIGCNDTNSKNSVKHYVKVTTCDWIYKYIKQALQKTVRIRETNKWDMVIRDSRIWKTAFLVQAVESSRTSLVDRDIAWRRENYLVHYLRFAVWATPRYYDFNNIWTWFAKTANQK